jgi:hypothetical protein
VIGLLIISPTRYNADTPTLNNEFKDK